MESRQKKRNFFEFRITQNKMRFLKKNWLPNNLINSKSWFGKTEDSCRSPAVQWQSHPSRTSFHSATESCPQLPSFKLLPYTQPSLRLSAIFIRCRWFFFIICILRIQEVQLKTSNSKQFFFTVPTVFCHWKPKSSNSWRFFMWILSFPRIIHYSCQVRFYQLLTV